MNARAAMTSAKGCEYPGCLCSIPACPCHRQHEEAERKGLRPARQECLWDVTDDQHMIVYWFCDTIQRYAGKHNNALADEAKKALPHIQKLLAERVRVRKAMGAEHVRQPGA